MLERVRSLLEGSRSTEAFFRIVGQYYPPMSAEYKLIERAYHTAEEAFRDDVREGNGECYFEHLRATTLIVMVYMRVRDVNVIVAALLHDLPENKRDWPIQRVQIEFNSTIAELL